MKKPNFWLYLLGQVALFAGLALCVALAFWSDEPAPYFLAGAFSVWVTNLDNDYYQRLRDYYKQEGVKRRD